MESLRKWFYKPKKDDKSLLAQFFYADEALNMIANELDSFDGRKDPERCTTLVNQLRQSQDKVLTITNAIMDVLICDERANRDFRVKFPEDVLQENLAGQLWFGAECLAAGSSIMNREVESTAMRPLAKAVTKSLENVRNLLRDSCLRNNIPNGPIKLDNNELINEMLLESLKIFDRLFADFELSYVSAMVPVKTIKEYELQELISVLFSETLQRALKMKLLIQDMIDDCDPALMFTIPRLAIVNGLLIYPNGPLCIDKTIDDMSTMFKPFRTLLHKIRELLWTLNKRELYMLEKLLCDNNEQQISDIKTIFSEIDNSDLDDFIKQFYQNYPFCYCNNNNNNTINEQYNNNNQQTNNEITNNNLLVLENYEQDNNNVSNDIPSTSSGYLITNRIAHDIIVAAITEQTTQQQNNLERLESPPDHDSLEVISEAAATLSSILTTNDSNKSNIKKTSNELLLESPNDSGISTENTSLDRSPSLDLNESTKTITPSTSNSKHLLTSTIPSRKRTNTNIIKKPIIQDEDTSSVASSSDTSSFNSNCADDEEIALAMQAAEIACRNEVRAKYRSSEDLIHRLFVCIAGVADQLQTNFASDLRNILKSVFLINTSDTNESLINSNSSETKTNETNLDASLEYRPSDHEIIENHNEFSVDPNILAQEALFDTNVYFHLENNSENTYSNHPRQDLNNSMTTQQDLNRYVSLREDVVNLQHQQQIIRGSRVDNNNITRTPTRTTTTHNNNYNNLNVCERPPIWIPDVEAPKCMSCGMNFTVVKRRHHCRNCGKVFCARCSSNSVPLPKFGHSKPVRVCNKCFIYNLTPFTM